MIGLILITSDSAQLQYIEGNRQDVKENQFSNSLIAQI